MTTTPTMKRFPIVPTILVALAAAAMIALGVWQLQRREWKDALLARYTANQALPPVAFPQIPIGDALLYRRTSAFCLEPVGWKVEGAGGRGWRLIAQCRTGAEGPGFSVELGTTHDFNARPDWRGGRVTGVIAAAPSHQSLIGSIGRSTPTPLMIVADRPLAGLSPSPRPSPASIPNNHLAYAVQWFIFATLAVLIYVIALRRRWRQR
jgi:cytochrome oxidase assembly protein ShyY1